MKINHEKYKKMTAHNRDMWEFAENLVIIEAYAGNPEVKGKDQGGGLAFLIVEIIRRIKSYLRSDSKESAEYSRQVDEDYLKVLSYIDKYPHVIDKLLPSEIWNEHKESMAARTGLRRKNINDKTIVIDMVKKLYNNLSFKPYNISKEAQVSIVYQIYKFAGLDNSYGIKYSDPGYSELRALDNIAKERQRMFKSSN